ncbi:MAG: HAMP domain-containing sensor histidine kinase [Patescibacteria group bacterium]
MIVSYVIWLLGDLVLWGNERIDHVMFFWTIVNLVEPIIFAAAYVHFVSFTDQRKSTNKEKILLFALLVPTVIMAPLGLSTIGFDYTNCDRNVVEGIAAYYNYFLEAVFIVLILFHAVRKFISIKEHKQQVYRLVWATVSLAVLLTSFLFANFFGTYFVAYEISQLGHVAVPIFAALLAYITIRFDTLESRILLIDVLTSSLTILIFSLLFIRNEDAQTVVVLISLALSIPTAYTLMSGIRKEVHSRQRIEQLAGDLRRANEGQSNLIHIINHQIKGYLAKARNIFSELLTEPSYGPMPETAKPMLDEGLKSLTEGVDFVKDFLDSANIEKGSFAYSIEPLDFKAMVLDAAEKQKGLAKERGLSFEVKIADGDYKTKGDKTQLGQATRNMIDNSIRYTPKGSVTVNLARAGNKILFSVKDTGVGLSEELKPKLFTQGGRAENSIKININSTGFGLSFVKSVAEGHKGRVWAESAGVNQGSTFYMELPVV